MIKKILAGLIIAGLLALAVIPAIPAIPVQADAAWLGTWGYRVKLTVDNGDIDGALSNFPLLLYISADSGYNSDDISCVFDELANDANRKKIAVTTTDGTTECYVEIEEWDDAGEEAWLWVKAPAIAADAATDFYLYYDSAHADNDARVGDTNDVVAENVWDTNFKLVSHQRDNPDTSNVRDSTQYDNDGAKTAANEPLLATGQISEAQDYDEVNDKINHGSDAELDNIAIKTVEAWIYLDDYGLNARGRVFSKATTNTDGWQILVHSAAAYTECICFAQDWNNGTFCSWFTPSAPASIELTTWYHIALVYDLGDTANDPIWYIDGVSMGIRESGAPAGVVDSDAANPLWTGARNDAGDPDIEFDGKIEEVRVSIIARNAAWIAATYETGLDHLLDWGAEEEPPPIAPEVTTQAVDDIEETTFTFNGTVVTINDTNITERGFVWDTVTHGDPGNTDPDASDYANNWTQVGVYGVGAFDYEKSGLTEGELYFVRACAKNDDVPVEWGYGAEVEVLTKPVEPNTFSATGGGANEIDLNWVKGAGAQKTYIRGEEDNYPDDRADGILVYNDVGIFKEHAGLDNGDDWWYRAWSYATEGGHEQYSDLYVQDWAIAAAWNAPTVATGIISGFSPDWAISNGSITAEGDAAVTQVRVRYGLTDAYGDSVTKTVALNTGDIFWLKIPDLTPGSNYHYSMGAFNGAWGNGSDGVFSTEGSPTLYEEVNTGGTIAGDDVYSGDWSAQQITVLTVAHSLDFANIYVIRTGNPGDAILSIRHADDADKPSGTDLDIMTLDGDLFADTLNWVKFDFPDDITLEAGESYALVLRCPDGTVANYLEWRLAAGSMLADAVANISTDGGISWTNVGAGGDHLFEVWGEPVLEVKGVQVFTDYLEDGDMLFVATYRNYYKPLYPSESCPANFYIRLIDDTTMIAQTTCPAWRYRPGAIYVSKAEADGMEWGATDYKFRLYGDFGTNPYTDYNIAAADWRGADLEFFDAWVILQANVIGDDMGVALTTDVEDRGEVLNSAGRAIFTLGIPSLSDVRGEYIFAFATWQPDITPSAPSEGLQASVGSWEDRVGATVATMLNRAGQMAQIEGKDVGAILCLIMVFAVIILVIRKGGSFRKGVLLGSPFFFASVWVGFIDVIIMAVVVSVLGVGIFAYKAWLVRS